MKDLHEKRVRWWPLILIWVLGTLATGVILILQDGEVGVRQEMIMKMIGVAILCFVMSVIWLLLFSSLRAKYRFQTLGLVSLVLVLFASTVRYGGVTGDLVPIFTWRWSQPSVAKAEEASLQDLEVNGTFPQFLGPHRNATVPGIRLNKDWTEFPPALLWRKPIGEGWSGFAISDNRAITQEQDGEDEVVSCFDLFSGEIIWQSRNEARFDNPLGGVGPRATPTIDEDRVYTVGATGYFACRRVNSGELIFGLDLLLNHNASLPEWGLAGSPLVFEDLVILSVGGRDGNSLVAYDKLSGDLVWRGGNDKAHWSSPVAYRVDGEEQILIFNKSGVAAHSVENGGVLWGFPWTKSTGTPRVAIPVQISENQFVISSGYGAGASMFQVSKVDSGYVAEEGWRSLHLKSKFNNYVFRDGYIYGLDDGMLTCIDAKTGRRTWKKGRYGHGQFLLGEDWLLLMAENGEAMLFEPSPEEPKFLGSFTALTGKSWNPPAIVGSILLVRNHLEVACYRLPLEE